MLLFEKVDHVVKIIGQGASINAVSFHSQYSKTYAVTEQEIKEAAIKYPNWVLIKNGDVFTDKEIIEKHKEENKNV